MSDNAPTSRRCGPIGATVRGLREEAGLSFAELVARSQVGRSALRRIEEDRNTRVPSMLNVAHIARALTEAFVAAGVDRVITIETLCSPLPVLVDAA